MHRCTAMHFCLVLVLCNSAFAYHHEQVMVDANEVDSARWDLVVMVEELVSNVIDPRWKEVNDSNAQGADVAVAKAFGAFVDLLRSFPKSYETWFKDTPVKNTWVWTTLGQEIALVDKAYGEFSRFVRHQANERVPSQDSEWKSLVEHMLTMSAASDRIHKVVIHARLYMQMLKESQGQLCDLQMSPQQILYNTYNTVNLMEMKTYAMIQFAHLIKILYGEANYTDKAMKAREDYESRIKLEVATAKASMIEASRMLWRCDPNHHEEGNTYVALTRLLQGYIENEVDMNDENTCRENCAYYQIAKNHGCFKDQYCSRQPVCSGKILNCKYIDSDMWICPAAKTSSRRYEWIEYENGRSLGKKGTCLRGSTKVDSWWRWGLYHCSYCLCVCDEPSAKSDRFISMDEMTSDVEHQKVVTGLRFVKMKRVIYIQISEGTLLPGGKIDEQSVAWRDVKPKDLKYAVNGKDYHAMSNEERAIDLDDLEGPSGYVLTGVRFKKLGAHLNFEVQVMPFNFTTGKLNIMKQEWISNDNTNANAEKPRTKLKLYSPDVPTAARKPSTMQSSTDQFIEFTHTDFDKDAAQSTVPYIDAQPATPAVHVPLSGAGLYFKGNWESGGFIGPKIYTYDYTNHINDNFPISKMFDIVN